jgi:RNA polymerase sigma factor (sigma-70 family)
MTKARETRFVTTDGVTVVVDDSPPPLPRAEPPRAPEPARVVIRPPVDLARERDARLAALVAEHGGFLRRMLLRRRDILPESAKDVAQKAFIVLSDRMADKGPPDNVRGFLVGVVRREIANHKAAWKPPIEPGADGDAVMVDGPDPEALRESAERWEKLMRYLERLPAGEADAFERVELDGKTIDEAARELGRARSTVADQLARARERLSGFALASARAVEMGERRRKGG